MFESSVDGFGGAVACAGPLEGGQHVGGPLFQGSAQPAEFDEGGGDAAAEAGDQLVHQVAAAGGVGVAVGGDHALVGRPGDLDGEVIFVGEQGIEAALLFVGEQAGAGVQGPARRVERVTGTAAVAVEVLLDPAAALVEGIPGEADDVEGSITATASGSSSVVAVLKPVKPSIATTSTASRQAWSRSASQALNTLLERPSTMSSSLAGPLPVRGPVRSMITVTYLSPRRVCRHTCSSTPMVVTPSNRCGLLIRTRWPSASTARWRCSS